ncbi:MAG: hypothetical protein HON90_01310, partial [Halobacteriovoraceae bacterium]|nr:hypothetical protein [Halobacteriovoraceae bacterium]
MKLVLVFTFMIFLTGCLPEQEVRPELNIDSSASTITDETLVNQTSAKSTWYNSGITNTTLTIDVDNAKSVYLIGDGIQDHLESATNFRATYCLEVRFAQTAITAPRRLRVKVTPVFTNQLSSTESSRILAVNIGTEIGNNFCDKSSLETVSGKEVTIVSADSNYDSTVDTNDIGFVYKPSNICTNCTNILTSNEVILYQYDSEKNALLRVENSIIEYSNLNLRVDMNSNSSSGQSTCTNSECVSLGFDCCQQGQCIKEKTPKLGGVAADPVGYAIAESEKLTNENWYRKYSQFYYACLELPPENEIPQTPVDPVDPTGDAETRLEALILDYNCIEELKSQSLSDPFHTNPINSSVTYSSCNTTLVSDDIYYKSVMSRMYLNCGCVEKTDVDAMIANCPAYTYEPLFARDLNGNLTNNILALSCKVPAVNQTPMPFQNLEIAVNSKSAPHRFFDTNNIEINPYEALPAGASGIQEGESFQYLDTYYIFPSNGSFNMNSILGQMNIQLNQAHPAYKVDLDFDRQYIISTRNGFYQSCPTCAKDSWFNNFSAFPFSNMGVGQQAVGYTTRRDTFSTNLTLGNYEDSHFSRACYVPPTMLPFGHEANTNSQTQRLNRLKTQAALFANGYQKDWYGFNRGALIGSFDGVTWFAVGKGRIVKSTSNTLYLAINAPFADLASPSNHIVSVQEYDYSASGAVYDYDPLKAINHPEQNEAGSCQEWHKCNTDTHCITKLGWEYVCADVNYHQTRWPQFEAIGADEIANTSRTGTIAQFLQQGSLTPNSDNKRCVYRGAGSPCRIDYDNITDENL